MLKEIYIRPCGNSECSISTFIDEESLTFGSGHLDDHGCWEHECDICAKAYKRDNPDKKVLGEHKWALLKKD